MRFRKKPVEVAAIRWREPDHEGSVTLANGAEVYFSPTSRRWCIDTLEGLHYVSPGDWVVRGIEGEFYPVKPRIFEATYEAVE